MLAFKKDSALPFYTWRCGDRGLEIFKMFSKGNFPDFIDKYIDENKTLEKFKNYIDNNQDLIRNEIIKRISKLSGAPKNTVKEYLINILNPLIKGPENNGIKESPNNNNLMNEIKTVYRKDLKISQENW